MPRPLRVIALFQPNAGAPGSPIPTKDVFNLEAAWRGALKIREWLAREPRSVQTTQGKQDEICLGLEALGE